MAINKIDENDVKTFYNSASMNDYEKAAVKSAVYPGQGTPLGLAYCSLKLNGEAGELAEHVGKAMRDDGLIQVDWDNGCALPYFDILTFERRNLIIKEAGDCLWYIAAICRELDVPLSFVAAQNLEKLMDRQERNKLQGSGDER